MITCEGPGSVTRWDLLKVSAGGGGVMKLLSSEWVRLATHFVGRTVLCTDNEHCPLCSLRPCRPYWYLPVSIQDGRFFRLLECSATGSADLEQRVRYAAGAFVAGVTVRVVRTGKRSPLRFSCDQGTDGSASIPVHEWVTPLMAIFGLPHIRPLEALGHYGRRVADKVAARAELEAARLRQLPIS